MDVVVLAGGKSPEDLRLATGCEMRADLPYRDRRVVDVVVDALCAATPSGTKITVVGATVEGCESLPPGKSFLESLYMGLEAGESKDVLVATADLPLLTADSVKSFVGKCDPEAAINWPIVPIEICEQSFPNMKRTTLKLREGKFTGGNLAYLNRVRFQKVFPNIEKAYRNRKSPLKLASQIGLSTLLRVLLGQLLPSTLSIEGLEKQISRSIGEPVRAVICQHAEIGVDIDTLDHYRALIEMTAKKV